MTADTPERLDDKARDILTANDRGGYTIPTSGLYPYQWNWDSAFAAWGFSTFDPDRAWIEMETLFKGQWDTGMVPHIIFWKPDPGYFPGPEVWGSGTTPATSGITQPPVAPTLARWIFEASPDRSRDRLAALYPAMVAWMRWFRDHRLRDGVICTTHPWETGRDNCPDWDIGLARVDGSHVGEYTRRDTGHVDASMRPTREEYDRYVAILQFGRDCGWDQAEIMANGPFLMADPGLTFITLRAARDLAEIGHDLGQDTGEIDEIADALHGGHGTIWNPDLAAYDARDMRTGAFAGNLSSAAFLADYAGAGRPELDASLMRVWDAVTYGIPSADPEAPRFDPRRYWRGPSWPFLNALIARGFADAGKTRRTERLRAETAALIRSGGFYEYFDPNDATPCGGKNFSWTAAIWLAWAGTGES